MKKIEEKRKAIEDEEKEKRNNYFKKIQEQEKYEEELKLKKEKLNAEKKQKLHEKNIKLLKRQEECKKKIEEDLDKLKIKINQKRNHSYITEHITINEIIIPNFDFNIKIDPTNFNDNSIQGEFGLGINLEGKNHFINTLYNNKIIFQKNR